MTIQIACDGSCIQQGDFRKGDDTARPGAAGFVARLPEGGTVGKAEHTPNGLIGGMEVKALRMGLEFAAEALERKPELRGQPIEIVCDSQYAVNGFNDWLQGWAAKGYHKKGGLANADEWRAIDAVKQDLGDAVRVVWTKGHSNHALNNAVDQLVNNAARTQTSFDDTHKAFPEATARRPAADRGAIGAEETARAGTDAFLDKATALPQPHSPAQSEKPISGIHAQAAGLLAQAAADPQLSSLLAVGLEMALDERRLTARYDRQTVDAAQTLQAALEKRGAER